MEQDFPIGSRVRFCGAEMWGEIKGKMATVVPLEEMESDWPNDADTGSRPGQIPCRLDEIGQGHLYWAPQSTSLEFVRGPERSTRCKFDRIELGAHIEAVKRLVRNYEVAGIKSTERRSERNAAVLRAAKIALREIEGMFDLPGCIPRGVHKNATS